MILETPDWFINLFWVAIGWYFARENGRDALEKEKEVHRTLAVQCLHANGMGKISDEDFDTHDRIAQRLIDQEIDEVSKEELGVYYFVKQKIDDYINLGNGNLGERIRILSINLGHWDKYRKE